MAFLLKMFTRATPAEAQPETLASADGTLYAVESNGRLQPKSSEATVTLVRDKPLQCMVVEPFGVLICMSQIHSES